MESKTGTSEQVGIDEYFSGLTSARGRHADQRKSGRERDKWGGRAATDVAITEAGRGTPVFCEGGGEVLGAAR